MNLLCLSDFNQGEIAAKAGDVRWFAPIVADRLLDSWPACWALAPIIIEAETVTEAIDAPPVDKMIHAPSKAKKRK
jgi:hypothetical protein